MFRTTLDRPVSPMQNPLELPNPPLSVERGTVLFLDARWIHTRNAQIALLDGFTRCKSEPLNIK